MLAIDLVEHLIDSLTFFSEVRKRMKINGAFLVFTGDTDSFSWRMFESLHWKCSLPEHIVFFNAASTSWVAEHSGFEIVATEHISHQKFPFWLRLNQSLRVCIWRLAMLLAGVGVSPVRRWIMVRRAPYYSAAKDHLLVTLKTI